MLALARVDGWFFRNIGVFQQPKPPKEIRLLSDKERTKYENLVRAKKREYLRRESQAAMNRGDHNMIRFDHAIAGLRSARFTIDEAKAAIKAHVSADRLEMADGGDSVLTLYCTRDWKKWLTAERPRRRHRWTVEEAEPVVREALRQYQGSNPQSLRVLAKQLTIPKTTVARSKAWQAMGADAHRGRTLTRGDFGNVADDGDDD